MPKTRRIVIALFVVAFVLQTCHEVEHLAQVYQRWWLGAGPQEAHGILFFLDVEWNHFLFNALYFPLLAAILFFLLFDAELGFTKKGRRVGLTLFILAVVIQGYHVVEHTVRMGQFFQLGCTPCPGILGWYIDLVFLHFVFNTATWLLPAAIVPGLWRRREYSVSHSAPFLGLNRGA